MYGLSREELRFVGLISSAHFTQHVYYRILPPLIPVLAVVLEYPLWQLGLLISVYSIGLGIAQAPLGIIADRIDRRYLLPTGLALTGAAYVLFSLAPVLGLAIPTLSVFGHAFDGGFLVMVLAMAIVGIGLAVVHPTGYPMITDNVEVTNKGKVLGLWGASSKLGDAATPAIIAGLILAMTWDHIVLIFGVAGVIYGAILFLVLEGDEFETVPTGQRTGEQVSASDLLEEDRRSFVYPMTVIYGFFLAHSMTLRGVNTFFPAFLVAVYAYSFDLFGVHVATESVSNVYFALLLFSGAVAQVFLGGLTDRHDKRWLLFACMAVATIGLVGLAVLDLSPILLIMVTVVLGAGLLGLNPARDGLISEISPPEYEGRTFGYIFTAVTLTAAPLPPLIGYVLEIVGMREGFLILALGTLLGAVTITLLHSERLYIPDQHVSTSTGTSD